MSKLEGILGAVYRKDFSALERLSREDVNLRDDDRRTPLMDAVLAEDADPRVVKLLIERGADISAVDKDQKWTALHFAARDQKDAVVRVLLEAGAAFDPVDVLGNTPLWWSVMHFSSNVAVIEELLKHGADPHKKNNYGVSPIDLARKAGNNEIVAILEGKA